MTEQEQITQLLGFNPNVEVSDTVWGTYVPGRRPAWKMYQHEGHATTSVKREGGAKYFLNTADRWELFEVWVRSEREDGLGWVVKEVFRR